MFSATVLFRMKFDACNEKHFNAIRVISSLKCSHVMICFKHFTNRFLKRIVNLNCFYCSSPNLVRLALEHILVLHNLS